MKRLVMTAASLVAAVSMVAIALPQNASAAAKPCTQRVFHRRSISTCVGDIQFMLNLANNANLAVDNDFGPKTQAAVRAWQARKGIEADGIVGPITCNTL